MACIASLAKVGYVNFTIYPPTIVHVMVYVIFQSL